MLNKLFIVVFVAIFALFLLSVFAPMHSEKRFWVAIHKIREKMDLTVYWFFNLCAILAVLYFVLAPICSLLGR